MSKFELERSVDGELAGLTVQVCPIEEDGNPGLVVRIVCDTRDQRLKACAALGINVTERGNDLWLGDLADITGGLSLAPLGRKGHAMAIERVKSTYDSNRSPLHDACREMLILDEIQSGDQHIEPGGYRVRPVDGITA